VENGADHMLISSNDNQEMQVSQTEGFQERNVANNLMIWNTHLHNT
jgi:hypothetical protein